MILRAVDKKEIDRILELARNGELTHAQKAWALTQAAKLIGKTDQEKALMLLDDATTEARRIDASDADRPRALIAIASANLIIDRKSTRLNSSHGYISYAVFCLKKKKTGTSPAAHPTLSATPRPRANL